MTVKQLLKTILRDHGTLLNLLGNSDTIEQQITRIVDMLLEAFQSGKKLLLCGNGGSAADAQHIAAELVGRFYLDRPGINAETLTVNTSSLTSIGNDYSFDRIYSRQVEAKGRPGDVLIGLTTSGTSKNIIAAFEAGKKIGMKNVCFTGEKAPASLDALCDVVLRVPSTCTPRIQECHILLGHIVCEYVEREMVNT